MRKRSSKQSSARARGVKPEGTLPVGKRCCQVLVDHPVGKRIKCSGCDGSGFIDDPPPMIECGCCGRTHEDIGGMDCRTFRTCDKCGDAYLYGYGLYDFKEKYIKHVKECNGVPNANVTT